MQGDDLLRRETLGMEQVGGRLVGLPLPTARPDPQAEPAISPISPPLNWPSGASTLGTRSGPFGLNHSASIAHQTIRAVATGFTALRLSEGRISTVSADPSRCHTREGNAPTGGAGQDRQELQQPQLMHGKS
jgi:hypothetical protein